MLSFKVECYRKHLRVDDLFATGHRNDESSRHRALSDKENPISAGVHRQDLVGLISGHGAVVPRLWPVYCCLGLSQFVRHWSCHSSPEINYGLLSLRYNFWNDDEECMWVIRQLQRLCFLPVYICQYITSNGIRECVLVVLV